MLHFYRKHLGPKTQIHVYEKSNKIGGRLAVAEFGGHSFEAGGSIIHSSNQYMARFINELGKYIVTYVCMDCNV